MSNYWFNNITILFQNVNEFFPKKEFNRIQKVNAIARLAIYYSILICFLKLDSKYLSLSFCLLMLSFYLGYTDTFESVINKENNTKKCTEPTESNPFMNFTIGDQIINPNKPAACPIDSVRKDQIKKYRLSAYPDPKDLFGKIVTDRNFYTMPSTTIVNDQEGFAKYVYGDFGKCKSEGKDCLKHRDNRFHRGRYYYQY
jgi:hypothetical protein